MFVKNAILNAIKIALNEVGVIARIPLTEDLIGPPLIDTLSRIIEKKDPIVLDAVANKFKLHYDTIGYAASIVYPGIDPLLAELHERGYALYVATNKRLIPTTNIIEYLDWKSFFSAIYSIDLNFERPFKGKSEMLSALLSKECIDPQSAIYIGDRIEDYEAATLNGLRCILVDWGYGRVGSKRNNVQLSVNDPIKLLNILLGIL
jgi:phosphoglycolate phosphatase